MKTMFIFGTIANDKGDLGPVYGKQWLYENNGIKIDQ